MEVEEIKRHFDSQFGILRDEVAAQGTSLRDEMATQGAAIRQDLRAEMAAQGASLREEMAAQGANLRADIADARREAGVTAEGLRTEIRQVADGVALANERIDDLDLRVDHLAAETRRGFADVRVAIRRLHEADDQVARSDGELRARVERLESERRA
jgi:hypothetical protein